MTHRNLRRVFTNPSPPFDQPVKFSRNGLIVVLISLFLLATAVRFLHWQDNALTVHKTMNRLAARYKQEADWLLNGNVRAFIGGTPDNPDTGVLIHPPGYPIFIAAVYKVFGRSDDRVRLFQLLIDASAAVLVFCIAMQLLPRGAAILAGVLVALSPQLSTNALPLLPESLAAIAILVAIYFIVLGITRERFWALFAGGAALGVSCWFRANGLLLAPFLALFVFAFVTRRRRWSFSLALVGAAALVIAPITIRNAVVFRTFIPLTLGTGQNLMAGIAAFDTEKRFGFEFYDHLSTQQEAQLYHRPDYAEDIYRPDGVERERARVKRATAVIRQNKIWFLKVMARRAALMLEFQPHSIISRDPPVTHPLETNGELVWSGDPQKILSDSKSFQPHTTTLAADSLEISIKNAQPEQEVLVVPVALRPRSDHLLKVPVALDRGRVVLQIKDTRLLTSVTIPDGLDPEAAKQDSLVELQLPFVSGDSDRGDLVVANASATASMLRIGRVDIYRLGPAAFVWTKYPRWLLRSVQKSYKTSVVVPLGLAGMLILALYRRWRALALLLAVPAYYLIVHSPLHVEPRYVTAIQYFVLTFVATALYWVIVQGSHLARAVLGKSE